MFEWTEEELEEGPEQLAVLEADTEVDEGPAWTSLFSSSNDQLKNQVRAVTGCISCSHALSLSLQGYSRGADA